MGDRIMVADFADTGDAIEPIAGTNRRVSPNGRSSRGDDPGSGSSVRVAEAASPRLLD